MLMVDSEEVVLPNGEQQSARSTGTDRCCCCSGAAAGGALPGRDDVLDLRHVAAGGRVGLVRGAPIFASVQVRGVPIPPVVRGGDGLERAVMIGGLVQKIGQR